MRGDLRARTEERLNAIARLNPVLRAMITVDEVGARAAADAMTGMEARPLPAGMLVAIKDNIDTANLRTTAGSKILAENLPVADAEAVRRLKHAGAIVIGKANMHEFAFGATTQNPHYGACRNPWNPDLIPGGSSGGSGAAVAAGLCDAALGTDTGGSVRIPAAFNGLVGLRPTFGRISARGMIPCCAEFDTIGILARTAGEVAALYEALAGYDPEDPVSVEHPVEPLGSADLSVVKGLRLCVPHRFFFEDVDREIVDACGDAIAEFVAMGATIATGSIGDPGLIHDALPAIVTSSAARFHSARLAAQPNDFGADVLERLRRGAQVTAAARAMAEAHVQAWRDQVSGLFENVDAVITPTVPISPQRIADSGETISRSHLLTRNTFVWSAAGVPAISVPCGFTRDGLPIGFQLVGPRWSEAMLLRLAQAYQARTAHHRARPAILGGDLRSN